MRFPRYLTASAAVFCLAGYQLPALANSLGTSFSVGRYQLDEEAAEADQYEESGLGLNVDLSYTYNGLRGAVGLGSVFLSDNAAFSQTVEDQFGNVSEADSSAGITAFTFEVGYEYDLTREVSASINAGYMFLTGSRSIENCSDCDKDTFDLDNGFYVEPEIGYYFAEWGVGARYIYSPGATVRSGFAISLLGRF